MARHCRAKNTGASVRKLESNLDTRRYGTQRLPRHWPASLSSWRQVWCAVSFADSEAVMGSGALREVGRDQVKSGVLVPVIFSADRVHVHAVVKPRELRAAGRLACMCISGHQVDPKADVLHVADIESGPLPLIGRGGDAVPIELLIDNGDLVVERQMIG